MTKFQIVFIILMLVVGLGIRMRVCLLDRSLPSQDALDYNHIATHLAAGEGYRNWRGESTAYRLPVYPVFLATVYRTAGHNYQAVRILQALISTLTVLLIAGWALLIFGGGAACLTALIAALYPPFYAYYYGCSSLGTETLYIFFLTGAFFSFFLYFLHSSSWKVALLSGVFWGLSFLTRGVALPLLLVLPLILLFFKYPFRKVIYYHLMVWAVVVTLMAPWVIHNYRVFGRFIPLATNAGEAFYASNHPGSDGLGGNFFRETIIKEDEKLRLEGLREIERSDYFLAQGRAFIQSQPHEAFRLFVRKIFLYLDPTNILYHGETVQKIISIEYLFVLLGSILGLVRGAREPAFSRHIFLMAVFFLYFLFFHAFYHSDVRYRFPSEPLLIIVSSYTLSTFFRKGALLADKD